MATRKGNYLGRNKEEINREEAALTIAAFNTQNVTRLPDPDNDRDYLSGFSFPLEDIKAIVADLENRHGAEDCKRVFFALAYHVAGQAGASKSGHTIIASGMVKSDGNCTPVSQEGWHVPNDAKLYDYCEPCPAICPTIEIQPGNPVHFKDIL